MKVKKPSAAAIKGSLRTRSFRAGGYSLAAAAVVVAIAVAINLVVGALPADWTKIDLTSTGLYSLSSQTQQMVSALEDEVTVYWIVQSGTEDDTIGELLERYQDLSKNLKVERKDPVVYPSFAQQYTSETLYNNSLIVACGDRSRYISYYDIYVTDYSSYYTTGTTSTQFDGESQLTSAVDYVTNEDLPVVYTLTGHGESELPASLAGDAEAENLLLEDLSLLTEEAVPEDADALIIYAPQSDISEAEQEMLAGYVEDGGRLLVMAGPVEDEELPNLYGLLEPYGVTAADGIVVEGDREHYAFSSPAALMPDLAESDITTPLAEEGYYVILPLAVGLTVGENTTSATVTSLLSTSDAAYSKLAGYDMATYEKEEGDVDGPFTVAVSVESAGGGDAGFAFGIESVIASCHDDVRVGAEPSVALPPVA